MRKVFAAACVGIVVTAHPALAGVYGDELTKCVVSSLTDADKVLFAKYVFAAMAEHPTVKPMANIGTEVNASLDRDASALIARLMYTDCRKQMVDVVKFEGIDAAVPAFSMVGQVAMRYLMTDPAVGARMAKAGADPESRAKLIDLYKDAGVPPPAGLVAK
jgi:hypothetical protein